jgi:hypothetical protein
MDDRRNVRASDTDRQGAADRLRGAMDEGRLDLFEYDTRLGRAYSAVTYGDLDELFTDLPAQTGKAVAPTRSRDVPAGWSPVPVSGEGLVARIPTPLKVLWTIWFAVLSINLTVWVLVSLSSGGAVYFWPMWLLIPAAPLPGITAGVMAIRRSRAQHPQGQRAEGPGAPALD